MIDLKELRGLARNALLVTCIIDRRGDVAAFMRAVNPNLVIELLDRLEAAEKVCDAAVRYCNPDDDDVCYIDFLEIVERWQQEVRQCADQQQKKS